MGESEWGPRAFPFIAFAADVRAHPSSSGDPVCDHQSADDASLDAAEAAQHDDGEHGDQWREPHERIDDEHWGHGHARDGSESDGDGHGDHRHAMDVHAHQIRHLEVVGGGADRQTQARAVEEEPGRRQHGPGDDEDEQPLPWDRHPEYVRDAFEGMPR